jgi:hypothetical protein
MNKSGNITDAEEIDMETDENSGEELFEHFHLEADKGQNQIRID